MSFRIAIGLAGKASHQWPLGTAMRDCHRGLPLPLGIGDSSLGIFIGGCCWGLLLGVAIGSCHWVLSMRVYIGIDIGGCHCHWGLSVGFTSRGCHWGLPLGIVIWYCILVLPFGSWHGKYNWVLLFGTEDRYCHWGGCHWELSLGIAFGFWHLLLPVRFAIGFLLEFVIGYCLWGLPLCGLQLVIALGHCLQILTLGVAIGIGGYNCFSSPFYFPSLFVWGLLRNWCTSTFVAMLYVTPIDHSVMNHQADTMHDTGFEPHDVYH